MTHLSGQFMQVKTTVKFSVNYSDPWVSQKLRPLKNLDPYVSCDTCSPSTCMIHNIAARLLLFFFVYGNYLRCHALEVNFFLAI